MKGREINPSARHNKRCTRVGIKNDRETYHDRAWVAWGLRMRLKGAHSGFQGILLDAMCWVYWNMTHIKCDEFKYSIYILRARSEWRVRWIICIRNTWSITGTPDSLSRAVPNNNMNMLMTRCYYLIFPSIRLITMRWLIARTPEVHSRIPSAAA